MEHDFVAEVADGSLPEAAFRHYLAHNDAFFFNLLGDFLDIHKIQFSK